MKRTRRITLTLIALALLAPSALGASDKRVIPTDELKAVLKNVREWALSAADLRNRASTMSAQDFIGGEEPLRQKLEEVIILIAQTKPAAADQQAAMLLAMGTKGIELGVWHYIYGALANSKKAMDYGDTLVQTGFGQLETASQLLEKGAEGSAP